ncbi:class I SAM-dependent methyltransferase [Limnohabitans radicicola]|uniref:Class I SAM-dependent methyltransferase n=1 Tax=Limnohabitans radicicola TaxID=2771427 RepID=A0A927IL28_9BURK|nr:class I SAM-dependent methyltransferase [Limnohabitans radicicola]MBD8049730.1 class I SAM-dependent methyltransferase [Limnohabitans radicicola]
MKQPGHDSDALERARIHWDDWQRSQPANQNVYTDWGDHPTVFRAVMRHALGGESENFFTFLQKNYPSCATGHALSLCCGDGAFEQQLLERGVFFQITGLELSPERIAQGRARMSAQNAMRLDFLEKDVNQGEFGKCLFDVIFAKAALHHIQNLEGAFDGMVRSLKPGGLLVTIDFFGPSRFQWTDLQLQACNEFWREHVPPALQREADGTLTPLITRPRVEDMVLMDPSEAARSNELQAMIYKYFDVLEDRALGGALLNLLLYGHRVNRFDAMDPVHNDVLERAVAKERNLMAQGLLSSDFRFIVARAKPWWRRFMR